MDIQNQIPLMDEKKRKCRKSDVWLYFSILENVGNGGYSCECKYCNPAKCYAKGIHFFNYTYIFLVLKLF